MSSFSKHVATVVISDPSLVAARCALMGGPAHHGAVWCSVPEIGMEGVDLIYCRYGLSIPHIKVQVGWKLLVEPTINDIERWFYVGLADCGDPNIAPADTDQLLIQLLSQVIYADTTGVMFLSNKTATEPFVLGNKLKTWCQAVDTAIGKIVDWGAGGKAGTNGELDVGGIAPLSGVTKSAFDVSTLSAKIKGE